jgi:hypothetical protein
MAAPGFTSGLRRGAVAARIAGLACACRRHAAGGDVAAAALTFRAAVVLPRRIGEDPARSAAWQ